jgi:hypothetical protein
VKVGSLSGLLEPYSTLDFKAGLRNILNNGNAAALIAIPTGPTQDNSWGWAYCR